jgi:hypothetical protein
VNAAVDDVERKDGVGGDEIGILLPPAGVGVDPGSIGTLEVDEAQCNPVAGMGQRISDMRLKGQPIEAGKKYKVAGWAPVTEEARNQGNKQVWEVVETWLKTQPGGRVKPRKLNTPKLLGALPNKGYSAS